MAGTIDDSEVFTAIVGSCRDKLTDYMDTCSKLSTALLNAAVRDIYQQNRILELKTLLISHQEETTSASQCVAAELQELSQRSSSVASVVNDLETKQRFVKIALELTDNLSRLRQCKDDVEDQLRRGSPLSAAKQLSKALTIRDYIESTDQHFGVKDVQGPEDRDSQFNEQPTNKDKALNTAASVYDEKNLSVCRAEGHILRHLEELQIQLQQDLGKRLSAVASSCISVCISRLNEDEDEDEENGARNMVQESDDKENIFIRFEADLSTLLETALYLRRSKSFVMKFASLIGAGLANECARQFRILNKAQPGFCQVHANALKRLLKLAELLLDVGKILCQVGSRVDVTIGGGMYFGGLASSQFVLQLSREADIQALRILNHFSETKAAVFTFFPEKGSCIKALRDADQCLEESVRISRICCNLCRILHLGVLESVRMTAEAALLGQTKQYTQMFERKIVFDAAMENSRGSEMHQIPTRDSNAFRARSQPPPDILEPLSNDQIKQVEKMALMERREALIAQVISLENILMAWSVHEALGELDEVPFLSIQNQTEEVEYNSVNDSLPNDSDSEYARIQTLEGLECDARRAQETICSTMVDDIFFIFNKVLDRTVRADEVFAPCALINNISNLLENEVLAKFAANLDASKSAYAQYIQDEKHVAVFSVIGCMIAQLKGQQIPERIQAQHSWIVSVNNLELCIQALTKFKESIKRKLQSSFHREGKIGDKICCYKNGNHLKVFNDEKTPASGEKELDSSKASFENLHRRACQLTLNFFQNYYAHALSFLKASKFDRQSDGHVDGNSWMWRWKIQRVLALLLGHFADNFEPSTQHLLCDLLLEHIVRQIEDCVLEKSFTIEGGLQLHAEIRHLFQSVQKINIGNSISSARVGGSEIDGQKNMSSGFSFFSDYEKEENQLDEIQIRYEEPVRPKFCRLLEMCELLGLSSPDEVEDLLGTPEEASKWQLSLSEIEKVLSLRVDFDKSALERILHRYKSNK